MSPRARLFLLAGCFVVLALEGPRTLSALAWGWSGPYPLARSQRAGPSDAPAVRTAAASLLEARIGVVAPISLAPISLAATGGILDLAR